MVGKPEGKRPLGIPRHRWEQCMKKNLQKVECGVMDWIEVAQDMYRRRELDAVMNLRVT
jgi:late competence protein required for DNA uptake (superfamily II DNA/RNA helicase)